MKNPHSTGTFQLSTNTRCLVALSGGADSVALLLMLKERGYDVSAAHCNFHLRGAESNRDEQFCVDLCAKLGVPLHRAHFDTREYADLHKESIEMAARELRYDYFRRLKRDIGADIICVAHHRDDTVETVLMNLLRGTGLHGLTGIPAVNGDIVRPLLGMSRREIEDYLHSHGQDYITDSSNLVDDVTRNKIRLDVIPLLKTITPAASANIAKTAARLGEVAKVFDVAMQTAVKAVTHVRGEALYISRAALLSQPSPEYTLFYILRDYAFTPAMIEEIHANIHAAPGREYMSRTHTLAFDRKEIIVFPNTIADVNITIPCEGLYVVDEGLKIRVEEVKDVGEVMPPPPHCALLDARDIRFPLMVRRVRRGDRFVPFGMKGGKLLSDFMTDLKLSVYDKRRQLVIVDAAEHILWVVGRRPDNRFRITTNTTQAICITMTGL